MRNFNESKQQGMKMITEEYDLSIEEVKALMADFIKEGRTSATKAAFNAIITAFYMGVVAGAEMQK